MQHHFDRLSTLAHRPSREVIGLMSGTSLDGLDVAWCTIHGSGMETRVEVRAFHTEPYDDAFKQEIRRVFAKKEIDFQHLVLLNVVVAERHAAIVNDCLRRWNLRPADVDLLASHGQTVFHAPRVFHQLPEYPNATLQIGDGDHLARRTGLITLSDFRQKHLAAGGEGAPLALYGDYFLFSQPGEARFLLNIGGIANFTWLPGSADAASRAFATDTGPGNTLLDAFAQRLFNVPFDENAQIASRGLVDEHLLQLLLDEPFFARPLPKTIGPELFSPVWVDAALAQLPKGSPAHNPYNLLTTLTRLTSVTAATALQQVWNTECRMRNAELAPARPTVFTSGGGAHNPLILKYLQELLPGWQFKKMEELGVSGDAKEAVLFAVLANECVAGQYPDSATLGGLPLVGMGKVSLPG